MKRALFLLAVTFFAATHVAQGADYSKWAVLIVSGDNRAHSGAPSAVFDNARRDLAKSFASLGFSPANMAEFAVSPDPVAQHSDAGAIATTLWDLSSRASEGCLVYFTSHGTPDGIIIDDRVVGPDKLGAIINNACGTKPSIIVISSCFSGQFVPVLAGDNRMVLTAARPDRTSFGCGELDHYTFFDDCFLKELPQSDGFARLADLTRQCVATRERQIGVDYPSEPQLSIGPNIVASLRWK